MMFMNMVRKILAFILLSVFTLSLAGFPALAVEDDTAGSEIFLNERMKGAVALYTNSMYGLSGQELKVIDPSNELITPFIQNSRMLVPIRFIAESLGATVSWDQPSQTATIVIGSRIVKIPIGKASMTVGGRTVSLDVPAMVTGDRTFIPLRAVSEALGKEVFYERGLVVVSDVQDIFDPAGESGLIDTLIRTVNVLPTVNSRENLVAMLSEIGAYGGYGNLDILTPEKGAETAAPAEGSQGSSEVTREDFSQTNVQVQGVDEADIVKTDGSYIYRIVDQNIRIERVYPVSEMALIGEISFTAEAFSPLELYVSGNRLVVIGSAYRTGFPYDGAAEKSMALYPYYGFTALKAIQYDISDRSKPVKVREVMIQGDYVSSRLIGSSLYLVANQGIYYWMDSTIPLNPQYMDSALGSEALAVPYADIRYMPPIINASYLMIAGFSLDEPDKPMNIQACLGAGEEIYVSGNALYVTLFEGYLGIRPMIMTQDGFAAARNQEATLVYKFALKDSAAVYAARGQVPGRILNQFSMDENGESFRIATTLGNAWSSGVNMSSNHVYILDEHLNVTGKLEDIAKGEQIYSVRFIGDRGYMVTFKLTDPFFVIDLEDPWDPKVLGALKIPGYSDYLHPYDEDHLIGFGKDTITVSLKDESGFVVDTAAYYLGMKVALFDVSDVSKPKEKFSIRIGDRGTESELLNDHKALLFSKAKNLLAFPVNEAKLDGPVIDPVYGFPNYGRLVFSGAYVYSLDLEDGFALKGRISHLTDDDYRMSGYYTADYNKQIRRMLYIDEVLYGVSNRMTAVYDMTTLKELNALAVE